MLEYGKFNVQYNVKFNGKELNVCHKLISLISISLQPDGANI